MVSSDPLTSLSIDPILLQDYATTRSRGTGKPYALITTKVHRSLPLAIHNYTNRAFSRQKFDALAIAARTLVTEIPSGKVVSRSFSKFFNHNEKLAYKPTGNEHAFVIEEKVDGSIITLFFYLNKWIIISRSAFDSPHVVAAQKILDSKYPRVFDILNPDWTYVFELVDPHLPVKIRYPAADLILLSVISKDGAEPSADFDWTPLPFPRPRAHNAPSVIPEVLRKLNRENEEGFVVKFWRSATDTHPQRIKIKFESYLTSFNTSVIEAMSEMTLHTATGPPSNASILATYLEQRLKICNFKLSMVAYRMEACLNRFLQGFESISDDYGGEAWLQKIEVVWDRIDALVSLQEGDWKELTATLEREGYRPASMNSRSQGAQQGFAKRIRRSDIDASYRSALLAWFSGVTPAKQVEHFINSLSIPNDLRSSTAIL